MNGKERGARSKERAVSVGRKADLTLIAGCLLLSACYASPTRAAFSFDNIEFWIGSGANRAALVIDWSDAATPPALVWGYRWNGTARGNDMLAAIVAADPRLFAKLGGSAANPTAVYGLGYDASDDGQLTLDDGTQFDAHGFAFSGPADLAVAIDPNDLYVEGWFTGFWHYAVESPLGANPFSGGSWSDVGVGMANRILVDGAWDAWAFENSTTPPFVAFPENPVPAPAPFSPADFNRDGVVDTHDYDAWTAAFGAANQSPIDANLNGVVDAADYVVWRHNFGTSASASSATAHGQVPEPTSMIAILAAALCFASASGRLAVRSRRQAPGALSLLKDRVPLLACPAVLRTYDNRNPKSKR